MTNIVQCKLSELISKINEFKEYKDVVFWDQFSYCETKLPYCITNDPNDSKKKIILFGGFHDGCCDKYRDFYFDEKDKCECVNGEIEEYKKFGENPLVSTTTHDLIEALCNEQKKYGDVDVVIWEQAQYVKFSNLAYMFLVKNDMLYIGGFHHNGDAYIEMQKSVHFKKIKD